MDTSKNAYVTCTIEDRVASIEFFHPAHNSLPSDLLKQLSDKVTDCGNNDDVLLIIIKSGGDRTFCAGASFNELVNIEDEMTGKKFFMGFANVINAIRRCPKLVIGRVHGKAVGGGVGLSAAFDYAMATKYASVKLSELAVGIGPFVIGPAVQRKMGLSAFSQLTINATEWKTAHWAMERGLYHEVFDTTEQLDAYLTHFIATLKTMNPDAMRQLKQIFWEGTDHWDTLLEDRAQTSGKLVLSDFSKKTIQSFLKT